MTEERITKLLDKLRKNLTGHELHEEMDPGEIIDVLEYAGDNWKEVVWLEIPTSQHFDQLYAESGSHEAFMYFDRIYDRSDHGWIDWSHSDVEKWLEQNPPFPELEPIADLYSHSRHIEAGSSPWLLFQYLIGVAVTSQGMGLNSLMGVGSNDAVVLGKALLSWGNYSDTAEPYVELLLIYGDSDA